MSWRSVNLVPRVRSAHCDHVSYKIAVQEDDPRKTLCMKYTFGDCKGSEGCEVAFTLFADFESRSSLYSAVLEASDSSNFHLYSLNGNEITLMTPTNNSFKLKVFDGRERLPPLAFQYIRDGPHSKAIGFFHESGGIHIPYRLKTIYDSCVKSVDSRLLNDKYGAMRLHEGFILLAVPEDVPLDYAPHFFPVFNQAVIGDNMAGPHEEIDRKYRTKPLFETIRNYFRLRKFYTDLLGSPLQKDFQGHCIIDDLVDAVKIVRWLSVGSENIQYARFQSLRQSRDVYDIIHESEEVKMAVLQSLMNVREDKLLKTIAFFVRRLLFSSCFLKQVFESKLDRLEAMPSVFLREARYMRLELFNVTNEESIYRSKKLQEAEASLGGTGPRSRLPDLPEVPKSEEQKRREATAKQHQDDYAAHYQEAHRLFVAEEVERDKIAAALGVVEPTILCNHDNTVQRLDLFLAWTEESVPETYYRGLCTPIDTYGIRRHPVDNESTSQSRPYLDRIYGDEPRRGTFFARGRTLGNTETTSPSVESRVRRVPVSRLPGM